MANKGAFQKGHKGYKPKGAISRKTVYMEKLGNMLSFFDSFKNGEKYYVYGHFNKITNECFYIGKGTSSRAWNSSNSDRNDLWINYVKINNGHDVRILISDLTEDEAFMIERILIEQRRPITNIQSVPNQFKLVV